MPERPFSDTSERGLERLICTALTDVVARTYAWNERKRPFTPPQIGIATDAGEQGVDATARRADAHVSRKVDRNQALTALLSAGSTLSSSKGFSKGSSKDRSPTAGPTPADAAEVQGRSQQPIAPGSWLAVPKTGTIIPIMGTQSAKPPPPAPTALADALFTPVQQRVLGLLFGQPERRFQSAELIRLAGAGTGAVHRLLTRLAATGLAQVETVGKQKFYRANERSPVYAELVGLVRKTVGLAGPLQAALAPLAERITAAFVYGSVAKGADRATSDIDLMVIADDLDYATLTVALAAAEETLARPVNANLMTPAEWRRKRAAADSFAARIAAQPKVFVIGSEGDLG